MRGDGGVYQPKDGRQSWYCWMPAKPKRAIRGPFRTEAEARRAWKDLRREVAAGRYRGPEEERITVADLIDAHRTDLLTRGAKSMVSFAAHAKAVVAAFGTVKAVALTADAVNRARRRWLDAGKAEATTDRYLETLRAAYRLAVKQKRIGHDRMPYIEMIRPNNRRTGFVDEDVFWKLYRVLPSVEADAALFAYRSGWRRSEVQRMAWEQIDAESSEARLWDSKNGRGRVLPLEGGLWEVVQRRQAARKFEGKSGPALSAYVFHYRGRPLGDWRKTWQKACVDVGVGGYVEEQGKKRYQGLLFHDFRRSTVRNLTRAGIPAVIAMEITGHRTRSVFDRYDIATTAEAREALRTTVKFLRGEKESPTSATEQLRSE